MKKFQTTSGPILLVALLFCIYLYVCDTHSEIINEKNSMEYVVPKIKLPTRSQAPQSNILYVWHKEDGTLGSHNFTQEEFYKISLLAINLPKEEFEFIMERARITSKEEMMVVLSENVELLNRKEQYAYLKRTKK